MGVIENGTFKGEIPNKSLFAVNYPGYPTSISRAIETLGGKDGISKARLSENNYLELRFRPEDPFAHPAFGELHGFSGLLLELSTEKGKEKGEQVVRGEIIAKVDQSYEFGGLADYQYVAPVHLKLGKGRKRQKLHDILSDQEGPADTEQEEMMILPPPLFSVKDVPEELVLQPSESTRASQRKALLCQQPWEMDIAPCFNLDFKIKEIPPKVNWEKNITKDSPDWPIQSAIANLFEERPIWAKPTIDDRLMEKGFCINDLHLRRFLFRLSYYFAYGPFRTLYIKKGYDPRKDPESRIFQMMDFRMPKAVRKAAQAYLIEKGEEAASITWSDICSFKQAPVKKFIYLQLCDLQDEYIQTQIRRPPEQSMCNEHSGWFRRSTIVRLRHHIRVRFLSLIPGNVVRELEQIESKKLESLKNFDMMRNSWLETTACTGINNKEMGTVANDDTLQQQGGADNFDEEEEEEEEEEEDEEEEEEDYQPLEDLDFANSSQRDTYKDSFDSIPRSYLQGLLEKFPTNTSHNVGSSRLVDLSDEEEEYAIYEQDDEDDDH